MSAAWSDKLKHKRKLIWLVTLLALGWSAQSDGQKLNVVTLSGRLEPAQVKPGEKAKVLITAKVDDGWHIYGLNQPAGGPRPTKVALGEGSMLTAAGPASQPKPKRVFDPNFQIETETFDNSVTFTLPVTVNTDAAPGPQKIIAKITFQACDEQQCLPPRTKEVEVEATIMAASTASVAPKLTPSPSASTTPKPSPSPTASVTPSPSVTPTPTPSVSPTVTPSIAGPVSGGDPTNGSLLQLPTNPTPVAVKSVDLKQNGLFSYLWLALISGLLSLLTPCVFPMIPITVSFFTKSQQQSRGAAVGQALVYCLGMVLTYTVLGLVMAAFSKAAGLGNLAANPWMNLALTIVFVVFALNLFGMFEIRIPSRLLSKLDAKSQGSTSWIATLLMGLTFTLTSFTCTAAFVGTVLVAASQGEWLWAALGMMVFSSAFAFPFFLLALFPNWLKSLPKSGGWLNSVKVVMGFLELAAAFKFLSNVDLVWGWNTISRSLVLAAWIAIAIVTAIYLLGKFQLPYDTEVKSLGVVRMLMSVLFLGLAFYLLTGLLGARLGELDSFLPPARPGELAYSSRSNAGSESAKWIESYDKALEQARAQNKPVFLNFTGITCTNCRWMELNMLPQPEVRKQLDSFVLAELYTDRQTKEDEQNQEMQEKQFGTVALPLYAIISPKGETLAKFPGLTRSKDEFVRFLQSGASQFVQVAQRQ